MTGSELRASHACIEWNFNLIKRYPGWEIVFLTCTVLIIVAQFLDLNVENENILAAAVILAISSLSFIWLGFLGAVLPLLSPEKGTQATHILQALILPVSGVCCETDVLPG